MKNFQTKLIKYLKSKPHIKMENNQFYVLKELDLKELDFAKGMRYNPFDYIKSQKDILKLLQVMQRQYDLAKKEKLTEKTSIRAKIKDYQEKESIKERDKPLKQVKHEKEQEL